MDACKIYHSMNDQNRGPADIQQSIEHNNLKLSADKILQGLKKVRNEPSKSRRRWIWELLQNAKDIPNKFEKVKVRVELDVNGLTFAHNGDPFTIQNITGLIQQVSTKASGGDVQEVTGKFGTGFISTHLLSEKVKVRGITIRPEGTAKRFEIELDRTGRNSEELMPYIQAAIDRLKRIDEDPEFAVVPDYLRNRKPEHLDTQLTYPFATKKALTTARVGLDDLRNTLPFTLANVNKIEEVVVSDVTRGIHVTYRCEIVRKEKNIREVVVSITSEAGEQEVHIICWDGDGVTLMAQVEDFEAYALVPNFGDQPTLYRQFPLIGSERFHFPFMLNGEAFFPTEERDGLLLNSEEDEDTQANRQIIATAMDEAVDFATWLVEKGARNRYVLAYTRVPDIHWEDEAREWYDGLQLAWRKRLRELPLVENEVGGVTVLKDAFIPKYGSSHKVKERFWDLYAPFRGFDVIPRKDLLHNWIEALGPQDELDTWGDDFPLCFDLGDLFSDIQGAKVLKEFDLSGLDAMEPREPIQWLVDTLQFAVDQKESELLNEYAVIPDQHGALHKLEDLYEESAEESIPDEILDVMEKVGLNWRGELIDRDVRLVGLNHETRSIRDASGDLNEILTREKKDARGQLTDHFLFRDDARDILLQLLSIVPKGKVDSFRLRLLNRAGELFKYEIEMRESDCAKFEFGPAIRLLVETMHDELEALETIAGVAEQLGLTGEKAIIWMDGHLSDLDRNAEHKSWLEYGNVIPSHVGDLGGYGDLLNYGSEEAPLNDTLLKVLKDLNPDKDQYPNLIADGIGIRLPKTLTMAELGALVQECVKLIRTDLASGDADADTYRKALLELIDWCEENEDEARRYLGGFLPDKDGLFFALVARGNIGTGVIKMLSDPAVVDVLKQIKDDGLDLGRVGELLRLGAELESLDGLIEHARQAVEEKQDFNYKKVLGEGMEQVLKEALDSEGFTTTIKGLGSYDIEVSNPANDKRFYIELKSISQGSSLPLKLAPSQVREWVRDVADRSLCLIERGANGTKATPGYIKKNLHVRMALAGNLRQGNEALDHFAEAEDTLEIPLLGQVRVPLAQPTFMVGAQDFTFLIKAIKKALA